MALDLSMLGGSIRDEPEASSTPTPDLFDTEASSFIKGNEGFRSDVFADTEGFPTVGFGRKLPDEFRGRIGETLPQEQLDKFFQEDFASAKAGAERILAQKGVAEIDPVRKTVLTDLAFNLGASGLGGFNKTFEHIKAGDFDAAATELLDSKYAQQVPERARRNAEILRSGKFPGDEDAQESAQGGLDLSSLGGAPVVSGPGEVTPELGEGTEVPRPGLGDIALGTVETAGGLGYGALAFLPAQLIRHSAIAGQKIQQKLGLVPKMSPQEQAEFGEDIANDIQTLGGLAEPRTISGRASLGLVSDIIQPVTDLAHWAAAGVDPEKHPNLHNALATVTEFGLFAAIPKVGRGSRMLAKKAQGANRLRKQGKIAAAEKADAAVAASQAKLIERAEAALKKEGALEEVYASAEKKLAKVEREAFKDTTISGQGGLAERIAEQRKAVTQREGLKRFLERKDKDVGEVPPVIPVEERVPVTSEVPKIEADPGKFLRETVEAEPAPLLRPRDVVTGERPSVTGDLFKGLLEPLRNERGAIQITKRSKTRTLLDEAQQESVRKVGLAAEEAGMKIGEFLRVSGMSKEDVVGFEKLHEQMRVARPNRAASVVDKVEAGVERPNRLFEGVEAPANPKSVAEGKVAISPEWLEAAKASPRTRTPGIVKGLKTSLTKFSELGGKFPELWHASRDARKLLHEDTKIADTHIKDLHGEFKNKKLREEAGALGISQTKNGTEALNTMKVAIPERAQYQSLLDRLEPLFEDLHTRLNETRAAIGKRPIPKQEKYLPFFAQESFYDRIGKSIKGEKLDKSPVNLVTDGLDGIAQRHAPGTVEATNFRHLKRGKLRTGTKLELDPLEMYARYNNTALKHIHNSPINAFVKELTTNTFTDPAGKKYNMRVNNPELAEFLGRWSNSIAGVSNVPLPKGLERGIQRMNSNFTSATLGWSARTALVQPSALLTTGTEFGIAETMKGLRDTITRKKVPIDKSRELGPRVHDAFLLDTVSKLDGSKIGAPWRMFKAGSLKGMSYVDYVAAEATWRTAYNSLKKNKKGASDLEAIRFADDAVVRTQGAGDPGAISPIQMNALGRAATLWQTFTINQANFIAREVLGIKNPDLKNPQVMARVMKFSIGAGLINALFQEGLGIQGPFPSPINNVLEGLKAGDPSAVIALSTMLEMGEGLPGGGSVKFGSSPLGPLAEYVGEISNIISGNDVIQKNVLPNALAGDKKAMLKLGELLGQGLGVPATKQTSKFIRARGRGESVPGAIIGRFEPKKGKKKRRKRRVKRRVQR
jgi:lysozyme